MIDNPQISTSLPSVSIPVSHGKDPFFDAFISYGRADSKVFTTRLCERLSQAGFQIWFDQNDIPLGVDFQEQINDGIEKSHNFLFVIAPHSVNSPYCLKEIELAIKLNKRIIPILHVEEVSYETWQRRNPAGTVTAWEEYTAKGKHSCFVNMHPNIGKINWVYGREEIDDFDAAIAGLIELFKRDHPYVYQHTVLLTQALEWERHQRQSTYLLTGSQRLAAAKWLATRFERTQAPCLPTLLHCELITESTKAAEGGMSQVFVAYAEENFEVKEQLRHALLQAGITVWSNTIDIRTGEDFQRAIQQGLETADNIVYLISSAALASDYCQAEIQMALTLHKRIIPILLETIDLERLSESLKTIQFIDLTPTQATGLDLETGIGKLLRTIRQDAAYYDQHKRLLVRALKWQRQQQNPSLLLRHQALKTYTAWMQIAKDRPYEQPLAVQKQFLEESQKQPPEQTIGVFICHHPDDIDFSAPLNETLLVQGKSTWFIPEGAEGTDTPEQRQETQEAINNAENFLFVISGRSVASNACLQELTYAQSQQKRIIPVIYQDLPKTHLPTEINALPWCDFRHHQGNFLVNFGELFRTLESHPVYVKTHTRLLMKALEWEAAGRDDGLLLRGKALAEAEQWLAQVTDRHPQPTDLQQAYLQASQALPFRKIKGRSVAIATFLTTLCVSGLRLFGGLQPLETLAYDQFLRLRPNETPDERILIVKVDSPSGEWLREQIIQGRYEPGIGTIPDAALEDAIATLQTHQARLIGLDFFRDFPAQATLAQRFQRTENLFGICQTASRQVGDIANEMPAPQVGFGNLLLDGGKTVRRHYLQQWGTEASDCPPTEAFSLLLAKAYLAQEKIPYQDPYATENDPIMRLGNVAIPELYGNGSGYSSVTEQWGWSSLEGYQSLLNYRRSDNQLEAFAANVSLSALLQDQVAPELIRDRIVLIGYTDFSDRNSDDFNTPYQDSVPGVYLHGQMISQLINAVLENRPLIRWWPFLGETGWIFAWAAVGGIIYWRIVRPRRQLAASIFSIGLLTVACYGFFIGPVIWVPWVPALIGWGVTASLISYLNHRLRKT